MQVLPHTVDGAAGPGMNPRDGAPSAPRGRPHRLRGATGRCPPHGAVLTVVRGYGVDGASADAAKAVAVHRSEGSPREDEEIPAGDAD